MAEPARRIDPRILEDIRARDEDERVAMVLKWCIVALALRGDMDAAEARRLIVECRLEAA